MAQIERKVTFDTDGAPSPRVLAVGMQGDNHARLIRFAAPEITEAQRVYVVVESGSNQDKIRLYQDDEGLWGWTISRSAMAIFGNGWAQVQVTDQTDPLNIKWQSGRISLSIGASMDVDADLSQSGITLIEQMQADMIASERVVEGYAQAAAGSAAAASESATDAAGSAGDAAGSAEAADTSAQAAALSVQAAADSATAADGSAQRATSEADRSAGEVSNARAQAEAAAASATAAALSAQAAAESAEQAGEIASGSLDTRYVRLTQYTDAAVLDKVKAVDGAGSGLDADTLDGLQASELAKVSDLNAYVKTSGYTAADVLSKLKTVDGAGSGLDADTLDGQQASAFATTGALSDMQTALKSRTVTATATAAGWTGSGPYTQEIAIAGMTATLNAIVGLSNAATAEQRDKCRAAMITPTAQGAGTITLTADGDKPGIDLPIGVTILEMR